MYVPSYWKDGGGGVRRAVSTQVAKLNLKCFSNTCQIDVNFWLLHWVVAPFTQKHFKEITPSRPCAGNEDSQTQTCLRPSWCSFMSPYQRQDPGLPFIGGHPNHLKVSAHLQTSKQGQHLLSYFETLSMGPSGIQTATPCSEVLNSANLASQVVEGTIWWLNFPLLYPLFKSIISLIPHHSKKIVGLFGSF